MSLLHVPACTLCLGTHVCCFTAELGLSTWHLPDSVPHAANKMQPFLKKSSAYLGRRTADQEPSTRVEPSPEDGSREPCALRRSLLNT